MNASSHEGTKSTFPQNIGLVPAGNKRVSIPGNNSMWMELPFAVKEDSRELPKGPPAGGFQPLSKDSQRDILSVCHFRDFITQKCQVEKKSIYETLEEIMAKCGGNPSGSSSGNNPSQNPFSSKKPSSSSSNNCPHDASSSMKNIPSTVKTSLSPPNNGSSKVKGTSNLNSTSHIPSNTKATFTPSGNELVLRTNFPEMTNLEIQDFFRCADCHKTFPSFDRIVEHRREKHRLMALAGPDPNLPKSSHPASNPASNLPPQDKSTQNIQTGKKFKCSVCQWFFPSLEGALQHFGEPCAARTKKTVQGQGSRGKSRAKKTRSKMEGEPPLFRCPQCPYTCQRKCYITRHQNMHDGARTFKCPSCALEFKYEKSFHQHRLRMHPEVHPEVHPETNSNSGPSKRTCPHCALSFREMTFQRHIKRCLPQPDNGPVNPGWRTTRSEKNQDSPKISAKIQDSPKISAKIQDSPKIFAKIQDSPKISAKIQDSPKISEKIQDSAKISAKIQDSSKMSKIVAKIQDSSISAKIQSSSKMSKIVAKIQDSSISAKIEDSFKMSKISAKIQDSPEIPKLPPVSTTPIPESVAGRRQNQSIPENPRTSNRNGISNEGKKLGMTSKASLGTSKVKGTAKVKEALDTTIINKNRGRSRSARKSPSKTFGSSPVSALASISTSRRMKVSPTKKSRQAPPKTKSRQAPPTAKPRQAPPTKDPSSPVKPALPKISEVPSVIQQFYLITPPPTNRASLTKLISESKVQSPIANTLRGETHSSCAELPISEADSKAPSATVTSSISMDSSAEVAPSINTSPSAEDTSSILKAPSAEVTSSILKAPSAEVTSSILKAPSAEVTSSILKTPSAEVTSSILKAPSAEVTSSIPKAPGAEAPSINKPLSSPARSSILTTPDLLARPIPVVRTSIVTHDITNSIHISKTVLQSVMAAADVNNLRSAPGNASTTARAGSLLSTSAPSPPSLQRAPSPPLQKADSPFLQKALSPALPLQTVLSPLEKALSQSRSLQKVLSPLEKALSQSRSLQKPLSPSHPLQKALSQARSLQKPLPPPHPREKALSAALSPRKPPHHPLYKAFSPLQKAPSPPPLQRAPSPTKIHQPNRSPTKAPGLIRAPFAMEITSPRGVPPPSSPPTEIPAPQQKSDSNWEGKDEFLIQAVVVGHQEVPERVVIKGPGKKQVLPNMENSCPAWKFPHPCGPTQGIRSNRPAILRKYPPSKSKVKEFGCRYCDKRLPDPVGLDEHLKEHFPLNSGSNPGNVPDKNGIESIIDQKTEGLGIEPNPGTFRGPGDSNNIDQKEIARKNSMSSFPRPTSQLYGSEERFQRLAVEHSRKNKSRRRHEEEDHPMELASHPSGPPKIPKIMGAKSPAVDLTGREMNGKAFASSGWNGDNNKLEEQDMNSERDPLLYKSLWKHIENAQDLVVSLNSAANKTSLSFGGSKDSIVAGETESPNAQAINKSIGNGGKPKFPNEDAPKSVVNTGQVGKKFLSSGELASVSNPTSKTKIKTNLRSKNITCKTMLNSKTGQTSTSVPFRKKTATSPVKPFRRRKEVGKKICKPKPPRKLSAQLIARSQMTGNYMQETPTISSMQVVSKINLIHQIPAKSNPIGRRTLLFKRPRSPAILKGHKGHLSDPEDPNNSQSPPIDPKHDQPIGTNAPTNTKDGQNARTDPIGDQNAPTNTKDDQYSPTDIKDGQNSPTDSKDGHKASQDPQDDQKAWRDPNGGQNAPENLKDASKTPAVPKDTRKAPTVQKDTQKAPTGPEDSLEEALPKRVPQPSKDINIGEDPSICQNVSKTAAGHLEQKDPNSSVDSSHGRQRLFSEDDQLPIKRFKTGEHPVNCQTNGLPAFTNRQDSQNAWADPKDGPQLSVPKDGQNISTELSTGENILGNTGKKESPWIIRKRRKEAVEYRQVPKMGEQLMESRPNGVPNLEKPTDGEGTGDCPTAKGETIIEGSKSGGKDIESIRDEHKYSKNVPCVEKVQIAAKQDADTPGNSTAKLNPKGNHTPPSAATDADDDLEIVAVFGPVAQKDPGEERPRPRPTYRVVGQGAGNTANGKSLILLVQKLSDEATLPNSEDTIPRGPLPTYQVITMPRQSAEPGMSPVQQMSPLIIAIPSQRLSNPTSPLSYIEEVFSPQSSPPRKTNIPAVADKSSKELSRLVLPEETPPEASDTCADTVGVAASAGSSGLSSPVMTSPGEQTSSAAVSLRGKGLSAGGTSSPKVSSPGTSSPKVSLPVTSFLKVSTPLSSSPKVSPPILSSPKVSPPGSSPPKVPSPGTSSPKVSPPVSSSPKVSPPILSSPKVSPPGSSPPKVPSPETSSPKVSPPVSSSPKVSPPILSSQKVSPPGSSPPKVPSPGTSSPKVSPPVSSSPKVSPPVSSPPKVTSPVSSSPKVSPPILSSPKVSPPGSSPPILSQKELPSPTLSSPCKDTSTPVVALDCQILPPSIPFVPESSTLWPNPSIPANDMPKPTSPPYFQSRPKRTSRPIKGNPPPKGSRVGKERLPPVTPPTLKPKLPLRQSEMFQNPIGTTANVPLNFKTSPKFGGLLSLHPVSPIITRELAEKSISGVPSLPTHLPVPSSPVSASPLEVEPQKKERGRPRNGAKREISKDLFQVKPDLDQIKHNLRGSSTPSKRGEKRVRMSRSPQEISPRNKSGKRRVTFKCGAQIPTTISLSNTNIIQSKKLQPKLRVRKLRVCYKCSSCSYACEVELDMIGHQQNHQSRRRRLESGAMYIVEVMKWDVMV